MNINAEIVVGQQNLAWLWSEYSPLSTKRREHDTTFATLVKSKAIDQFVLKTDRLSNQNLIKTMALRGNHSFPPIG
jgi:hypothetical protein